MTQPTPQPSTPPSANRDIVIGAPVYGVDNVRFGQVAGSYRNYLIVERGFFMPVDYYVPMNAVGRVDDDLVVLSVSRDAALAQGWERPPFTSETGQRGLRRPAVGRVAGTSPAAGAPAPGAITQRASQPAPSTASTGSWPATPTSRLTGPEEAGSQAATTPVAPGGQTTPTHQTNDDEESPPAAANGDTRQTSDVERPAATEPAPVTGAFADTYAVGTNTDSYQAMADLVPAESPSVRQPEAEPASRTSPPAEPEATTAEPQVAENDPSEAGQSPSAPRQTS